ncbi:hypothetical protein CH063_09591 [Colletotrichum higginsianum]|uniref:NUDIX domain-containing protein n=1 Tax=Colletotrichum higginsianum (strain IMI 349063) TaxID=759273 RepID=H1VE75_COLHI|nr:NUDIX domain-containing protein [Colletotrichum higginsianum IMI 349063]OBR02138.1 NUDIX domain-containing protein [Colletotrichum higginsianum IMI 349063]CCF38528.1 hypothetical protein CH063_09591 [Colletotrichum higginsianum]
MSVAKAHNMPSCKDKKMLRMGTMGILCRGTKVLIIRRRLKTPEIRENGPPDTWAFPGGALEKGETPEPAMKREYKEEAGVKVTIQPIGDEPVWGETDDYLVDDWRCFFFIVKQVDPNEEPNIMEPQKHVDLMWIDWNELWALISAQIMDETAGGAKEDASGKDNMRFFPSMINMVKKYPLRSDAACLEKRL